MRTSQSAGEAFDDGHAPEDEEMSRNTYPLKLPTSVKKAAAELAATDGVSLNQFIAAEVAEKVGSLRAADDFLREPRELRNPRTCSSICAAHRRWDRTQTTCPRAAIDTAGVIVRNLRERGHDARTARWGGIFPWSAAINASILWVKELQLAHLTTTEASSGTTYRTRHIGGSGQGAQATGCETQSQCGAGASRNPPIGATGSKEATLGGCSCGDSQRRRRQRFRTRTDQQTGLICT